MDCSDFKKDFLDEVKANAAIMGEGSCACFVSSFGSYLIEYGLIDDIVPCYFTGEYKRKKFRVDGYSYDDYDDTMNLYIADYDGIDTDRTLVMTAAKQTISRVVTFVDAALHSDLGETVDISLPISDLIEIIAQKQKSIRQYKIFLFTDANTSARIKSMDVESFEGVPVEAQIWDLNRLYEVCVTPENEAIEVSFMDYGMENGIPCIEANVGVDQKYKSFLGVIPGNVLAQLYDKYGARLLEGNVRSFLSTKVAVNKKIRETILKRPEMFFAYNNGISVTGINVRIETFKGMNYITSVKDFQIINGGQTTASLFSAMKKDNADLSNIYVQMKLTEINSSKVTKDEADQLIRDISRCSNSQNKVSDADFFASHPLHRQIEQISKVTYAPAVHGAQYETRWFYERARGQYLQEQMRLTPAQQRAFKLKNPKEQVIKKTDLAKVQNTWIGHPDIVSKGAQTNFMQFANYIDEQWQKDSSQFNTVYFQNTVSLMILFNYLTKYISNQPWYQGGYRANIVYYSVAYLHLAVKRQFPGRDIDLSAIWKRQEVPDAMKDTLAVITEAVFNKITDEKRPIMNVTQWCKRSACWDGVQAMRITLPENIESCLEEVDNINHEKKSARSEQRVTNGINAQVEVVKHNADYWKKLTEFAVLNHLVTEKDIGVLRIACQIPTKIPNAIQSFRLLNIESKASQEGFITEEK